MPITPSLITSSLTAAVNKNSQELMTKGLRRSRTIGLIGVRQGIKNTEHTFSIETTDLKVQPADCGMTVSGSTTILQIPVSINRLGVKENVCQSTLEDFFNSTDFAPGQARDDKSLNGFTAQYIAEKLDAIGYEVDRMLWQGDTANGSGNLRKTNGILKALAAVSASTQNIASSALTESNCISVIKAYYDRLPSSAKSLKTVTMFCSSEEFQIITGALAALNLYHVDNSDQFVDGVNFPYRKLRIESIPGLDGTTRKVVCANPKKLIKIGTDLSSDIPSESTAGESGMKWWFSQDDDVHYLQLKWSQGVGVGIPSYFVNDIL